MFPILQPVSKAYSVIATFTDIKGMMVNMGLYTPEFQDEKKPLLEQDVSMQVFASCLHGKENGGKFGHFAWYLKSLDFW